MQRPALWAAGLVAGVCFGMALLWGISGRLSHAPQDRPLALVVPQSPQNSESRALQITVLGTSLSHDELWPARLAAELGQCLDRRVKIAVVARPGAAVDWGRTQTANVAATKPDLVLVEFAINDADLRDGHSLRAAKAQHDHLIAALRAALPRAQLALMTMSPAQGLRGLARPRLAAHYRQYRDLAARHELGLIDLYPRWRALPRAARGLARDGLHPEAEIAADVIVPAVLQVLAGPACDPARIGP